MNDNSFSTIRFEKIGQVAQITLARPEVHNAFNSVMIGELLMAFARIKEDPEVRVGVLTGEGRSFCAGADLNWMREIVQYSYEQNLAESLQIAELHQNIYTMPKPTVAKVNGTAIGGGTGFLSACDIAIASEEARFGLSEVKLGLVPAAISPYVVRKIGESKAREYFLTGVRINAPRAVEIGLVNECVPLQELDDRVAGLVDQLLTSGPEALARCKELILNVARMGAEEAGEYTARMIADLRISSEGQEGMAAFLEKRRPAWVKDSGDTKE
jgi:methylglutaconyl-CoA hydratase